MRKRAGWLIIILSCLLWTVLPVVPFISLSSADKVYWGSLVFILAEITWYAGLLLLGPEAIAYIKGLWRRLKSSPDRKKADHQPDD